jgi:antitoxin (DNA-binding transcriptional repressor) of toxin-antitoxin stability system
MKEFTVTEVARNFSDFISRIHYQGEGAVLLKGGRPMVKVSPVHQTKTAGELAENWPGLAHLTAEEAESFERDLSAARSGLPTVTSKWD